ncbi:MAG TPA: tetratricopeptide repeat protein [Thermoanaerobaculia bacterium]|nr:tetratricopeptide repeat protein [Thermoanaerobaculia bacterium]
MKMMLALVAAAVSFAAPIQAQVQEFPSEPYDFIVAKLAAEDQRYDEALTLIDKVIAKNPNDLVLRYERAMILVDAGRVEGAEKELRSVTTKYPDFYDAQRILGRILFDRAGNDRAKIDDALTHLQAAFRVNPDDIATGMAVAQIMLATSRNTDAEKVLATLLERVPDQRGINYTYAQVLTKLGRGDESKQYLEHAVLVDPTFGPAILQLVEIYQQSNEWEKAADVLQPLINDDPSNLDLQRQQAYFQLRAGQSEKARASFKALLEADPKDSRSLFYMGEALNDLEQYEQAEKIYRQILEKSPEDAEVMLSFAMSQMGQKKWPDATKSLNTLLALKDVPEGLQIVAKTQLAYIELQKSNYAGALDAAKPILVFRDKLNNQAINIAVESLRKQKRYAEGVALLQPIVDKFSSEPWINARYIEMLARAGDKDRARVAAATQTKFGPRNAIAAAEAYIAVEDYPTAVSVVKEALKGKAEDLDLQFELGSAYERSGDRANAEQIFQQILAKKPDHAATLNYLGYMWAEQGTNLERAAEMLNRAVTQEPRNGAFIDSLGWVYFRQGKLDLAEKYLTDATKLLPRDATVHEHLGDVLAKRGDYNRALVVYRNALALGPEPKDEAKLKSKIADVEKQQTAQRQ